MKLLLIKHSHPLIQPGTPPHKWHLSKEGFERSKRLAEALETYDLSSVFCSPEPKAVETAEIVCRQLSLPEPEQIEGLHEHLRSKEPFGTPETFQAAIARLFDHPDDLVYGEETAAQASSRFRGAVNQAIERTAGETAVVTHGTVISLFVAEAANMHPFPLWESLGLPSYIEFLCPEMRLSKVVYRV